MSARANMQPAIANYLRRPNESEYSALAVDVLGIEDGAVAEVMAFPPSVFSALALPLKLSAEEAS